jgi:hypothetical protein
MFAADICLGVPDDSNNELENAIAGGARIGAID